MGVTCFTCRYLASHGFRWICRSGSHKDDSTGDLAIQYIDFPSHDIKCAEYLPRPQSFPLPQLECDTDDDRGMGEKGNNKVPTMEDLNFMTRRILKETNRMAKECRESCNKACEVLRKDYEEFHDTHVHHMDIKMETQYWLSIAFFVLGAVFFVFKLVIEPFVK